LEKYAFKMRLVPGHAAEYRRRHEAIWPELIVLLKEAGISDYSIHLDAETSTLFAVLWREENHGMERLSRSPLMRRWWSYMADIMRTNPDGEPLSIPLETMFQLT